MIYDVTAGIAANGYASWIRLSEEPTPYGRINYVDRYLKEWTVMVLMDDIFK